MDSTNFAQFRCDCKYKDGTLNEAFYKKGWDPRCRPWYWAAMKSQGKIVFAKPYLYEGVVYQTISR
jgi:hypothetical protein